MRACEARQTAPPGPSRTVASAASGDPASYLAWAAESARSRPARRVNRQSGGLLEKRSRSGQAATRLRAVGRALQLGCHLSSGSDRCVRAVPRAAVGIKLRIDDVGERPVDVLALQERTPSDTPPSARADVRSGSWLRVRSVPSSRPPPRTRVRGRAALRRATTPPRRRPARPPPPAAIVGRRPTAARAAAGSPVRCGCRGASRRAAQTRTQAPPRVSPRGNSSNASGLPRVSATIRSRTRSSIGPLITESSSARASLSPRPVEQRAPAARPARVRHSAHAHANTNATGSASKRRATKASVCAETRSSHCASSTRQSSGCSSATSDTRLSTASPTRNLIRRLARAHSERRDERVALRPGRSLQVAPGTARRADASRRTRAPSPTRCPTARAIRQPMALSAT